MLSGRELTPAPEDRLRVAVLTTSRAPGLSFLAGGDVNRGRCHELVAVLVTDPASPVVAEARGAGLPVEVHDLRGFCAARGGPLRDLTVRRGFDLETRERLAPYRPDVILLLGYLHVLTGAMLGAFPGRILNLHDADLAVRGSDGRPRYRGLRSTLDALIAGERETRSTAHLVTADVDTGPIVARSQPFPVPPMLEQARRWGALDIIKACAYAQREWMMRAAWGPLAALAIERVAGAGTPPHAATAGGVG